MRKLKTVFACLLMAVLSIGQVWAVDQSFAFSTIGSTGWSNSYAAHNVVCTDGTVSMNASKQGSNITDIPVTKGQPVSFVLSDNTKSLSAVSFTCKQWGTKAQTITLKYSTDGGSSYSTLSPSVTSTNFSISSNSLPTGTNAVQITFSSSSNQVGIQSMSYTLAGDAPTPTVSADPDEVENVAFAGVTDQTIDLTYENITDYETEVSVHPNADGTGTLSPAWLTASVSDADNYATVTYSVSANDGAARTAYIKVYTTDGDKEAETIIPVSQVKYSAPTGTFELLTGDLAEGDYVFVVDAKAMTNSVSSSRLTNTNVTIAANQIENPDESIIWHVAASGDYWTIYSAAVEQYAASTGVANKAQMLADGTDDQAKWSVAKTGNAFNFQNKANAAGSVNAKLQRNGDYGWACYASYSNISLYKKQVAGQPATPEFSVAGGNYETAQSVEISCETVGATIYYTLDGTTPTSASSVYSTALNISSTTTVKAIAIKNDVASIEASATYTIIVWQTVADVWNDITADGPTNAHIYGYVSQINVGGYDNNFYISDNGSTEGNQLYAYRMNMNSFSVAVGDKVKLAGDLMDYQGTKEFKYANSGATQGLVVALEAKGALQSVAVSGTPIKTEYAANEDFDPTGLKVMGTYANGFVGEITEGITWGNDLTDNKVTENTTVHVTATVSGITNDPAYNVDVTIAVKTLESIAVGTAAYTIYTGEALPQPVVTATFSEGEPENVSAFAVYDTESVFDTEVIDDPDPQTITVSYTFGGATQTATYTVSVKDYANADDAPYTVTEALHIITDAIGNAESAREIVVAGTVSVEKVNNYKNRYKISDGVNELLVYNGKGFNDEAFTDANYPKVGDVMIVKGKVINYSNNTPEFVSAKSYPLSQIRPATLDIENVASFEVGATDLTENDLVITTASDGDITFVSGDEAKATIIANAIHAVAPGTVTITANLAATENDDALNYAAASTTFDVTVIAATVKYAISFDGNGADGGSAPAAIADKAAGAEVTLPANTYTKTGYGFTGWKVYDENEDEVTVTAGAFTMPASDVTIKAQWAEISVWATTYTSNVEMSYTGTGSKDSVIISGTKYVAYKAGSGSNTGTIKVKLPYHTHTLHFHALAWNGKSSSISISGVSNANITSFDLTADAGATGTTGKYTLANDPVDQYFVVTFDAVDDENGVELVFSKSSSDNRFILYGVNQEGGVLSVLDHIAISGDLENKSYKAGDAINMAGLTVEAVYTLGGTPQTPVDITNDAELEWSYADLAEGDTEKELTATYKGMTDSKTITSLTVTSADPKIYVDKLNVNFASVEVGAAVPAAQTISVTLTNVAAVTATLGGTNPEAFSISKTEEIVSGDEITISILANTDAAASYSATIAISDGEEGAADKTVNLSFEVTAPVVEETAVSTTSKWVAATAADLVDGAEVLITGATGGVTYAIGVQNDNNRAAVAGTLSEGVFTPGENTMSFTLVAQEEEGVFALQASNGEYLYAASSSKNYLKRQATLDDNAKWTLTATSAVANGSNTHNDLKFNATNSPKIFSCYTGGQTAIQFYVPQAVAPSYTEVRTVAANRFYTICLANEISMFRGATLWDIESKDLANGILTIVEAKAPYTAGTPYIIYAEAAGKFEVVSGEGFATEAGHKNGLYGTFSELNTQETAVLNGKWILAWMEESGNTWVAVNDVAGTVTMPANCAYLNMGEVPNANDVNPAPGRRRVNMSIPKVPQTPTGVEETEATGMQKVVVNGNLYIVREGKMYDATGRLVK